MTDVRIYNLVKTKVVLVSQDQLFSFENNLIRYSESKKIEIKFEVTKEKECQ